MPRPPTRPYTPVRKQLATITVIGQDKTGVIAGVTNFLFEQKANIEALEEQVTRGHFSMTIQASWHQRDWHADTFKAGLDLLAKTLGMQIKLREVLAHQLQRVAIMVTREAHCMEGLLQAFKAKRLRAEPAVILSNYADLEPIAQKFGIPFVLIPWENREAAEKKALSVMEQFEIDFVVLARFMKILSPNFVWHYKNKIINIHPSLLPSFPGPQAYRQAYEHGVKIAGVTAHFVSMHLDEGPIIAQGSFAVTPSMTLKDIVNQGQKQEAKVLLKAVKLYLAQRLDVFWGVVKHV